MKVSVITIFGSIGLSAAFAPAVQQQKNVVSMNAEIQEQSRKAFLGTAVATVFASVPLIANAGTMAQENVNDPTEQWELGYPTTTARAARDKRSGDNRFQNARTQMNSNFAPIKRLTLERKSPVERIDIEAPYFRAYRQSYPGLYAGKAAPPPMEEEPPPEGEEGAEGDAKAKK